MTKAHLFVLEFVLHTIQSHQETTAEFIQRGLLISKGIAFLKSIACFISSSLTTNNVLSREGEHCFSALTHLVDDSRPANTSPLRIPRDEDLMAMMSKTTPKELCTMVDNWLAENYSVSQKLFDSEVLRGEAYVNLRKWSTNCWPLGPGAHVYLNIFKFLNSDTLKNSLVRMATGE